MTRDLRPYRNARKKWTGEAMPLLVNARLGPYEIRSTLGAGAMGEVYRARDTWLNRDVAIKVLREDDAASVESRSRFECEARSVAALNHPNIVAVYDFCIDAGQQYIVSENWVEIRCIKAGTRLTPFIRRWGIIQTNP